MILPKNSGRRIFHDLLDQSLPWAPCIGMGFACKDELYRIFRIIHDPSKSVYIREQKDEPSYM